MTVNKFVIVFFVSLNRKKGALLKLTALLKKKKGLVK